MSQEKAKNYHSWGRLVCSFFSYIVVVISILPIFKKDLFILEGGGGAEGEGENLERTPH